MKFKKPCKKCGKDFRPSSPSTTLCDKCWEESYRKSKNKKRKQSKELKGGKKNDKKRNRKKK